MTVEHVYVIFRRMTDTQKGSPTGHTTLTGLEMVPTSCKRQERKSKGMRVKVGGRRGRRGKGGVLLDQFEKELAVI